MDEPQRRGGGGEVLSKNLAGATYPDVNGGTPRFSTRLDDYAEIFGDVAAACSIPFLDLPPALKCRDADLISGRFDYSEVFGAVDFGKFAKPYEELVAVAPRREDASFADRRTKGEAANNQQAIEELFSLKHSNGGLMASRDCDPLSSNFDHSEYGTAEFNLLHKKTINQKKEGKMNGKVRTSQLHAAPAFGLVIDAETPAQDTGSDQTETGKQHKKTPVLVPSKHLRSSENHLGTDNKQFTRRKSVPDNCNANDNHNSSSSRSSMSSGDASSSQIAYLTVSDISLRTQPLQVPPPSRLPPRLVNKGGYPKARVVSDPKAILDGVSETNPVSTKSLSFFDVEVDASSATAISTAAIQEVMELAQAKLKSKKELMEKKCDIPQNMKKMSFHGCISSKEKLPQNLVGQNDENLASTDKRNQLISADKLTLHSKEKEKDGELVEDGQKRQGNDLRSPKLSKSADKLEKWKINKEYHELVNTEKIEMTEEVSEGEGSPKKVKLTTMISEVNQHKSMQDTLSYEIESNWKLKKDIVAPVACAHEENANLETHDIHLEDFVIQGVIQKLNGRGVREIQYASEKVHLFSGSEKNANDNSELDYALCNKRGKNKLDSLDVCGGENSSNFVEINVEEEIKDEKWTSKADACQGKRFEKEINTSNLAPQPSSVEGKLNTVNATAVHEAEIQVSNGLFISEAERTKGAYKCTVAEKTRVEDRQCNANNVNEIEKTAGMCEQLSATELKRKSLSIESELRAKVDQETYKVEEDLKDNRSTAGVTTCEEQDYKGYTLKQAQSELQQRDKKEAAPESCNLEKFEGHKMDRRHLWNLGNEDTIEIQVEPYFMDKYISINVIPGVSAGPLNVSAEPLNTNLHDHPTNVSEELSMLSNKCHIMDSDQIISDIQKSEVKGIDQMEKETEEVAKEERRVEEEKEKEIPREEKEKIVLLQSKLVEDVHTVRLLEERSNMEEKKEQAILFKETKEREINLKEEKEQARSMEESSERKNKIKDEGRRVADKIDEDKTRLSEQANGNQKNLQEEILRIEAKERERKVEEEKERARLVEEQKEREREREKDRIAMARAFAEAPERAENIAVGKVTTSSEVWQRTFKEVQVKSETASYESFEKSFIENVSRDSKLWTECATSKQATAEAYDCAVERAGAERAAADAREDSEKDNTMSRDKFRMDSAKEHLQAGDKDGCDAQFGSTGSSKAFLVNSDSNSQGEGESVLRCKARRERHQRIAERAAKALAEKNMRDVLAQREQSERERLAEYLDTDVRRWSNGKEGNLRALLSTLQYILSPESGWQPIPLTEVITASAVKKAFRKAALCVHPDKLQQRGANIQQKYISEKVFDLLKEAWNRFNSEES